MKNRNLKSIWMQIKWKFVYKNDAIILSSLYEGLYIYKQKNYYKIIIQKTSIIRLWIFMRNLTSLEIMFL